LGLARALQRPVPRSRQQARTVSIQDQNPHPSLFASAELRLWVPSRAAPRLDAKRVLDIAVSAAAILVLLPLLALISLAIALDSRGPILFCQRRHGRNGEIFGILKFRSMRVLEDGAEVVQAKKQDARITRIGRLLRRSSLDELPQLFNVLSGEMSLVGPRPHAIAHDEYYGARIPAYARRQRVKPGITGWAQVNGARGETPELSDMQKRIEFDAWYVDHKSLGLDLLILARTPAAVFSMRNAG
jgi:putative colanic acid biosysnthesis UDP-glucose lipid carrier transferase